MTDPRVLEKFREEHQASKDREAAAQTQADLLTASFSSQLAETQRDILTEQGIRDAINATLDQLGEPTLL